jgi:putative transcriptional regulator
MTGIRATTISDMYNNFAERVGLDQLDLICEALDCELGDLLILVPNSSPRITYNRAGNLIPQQKRKPRIK